MAYQHRFVNGQACELTLGKIVCVGRNYADHAKELNNPIPTEPMLFIKPSTAALELEQDFSIPVGLGSVHFETEMSVLIGKTLCKASELSAKEAIAGVGVGLDLTLRDLQDGLKSKGHPWEKAKAFDGACPLSAFVTPDQVDDLQNVQIRLTVNGDVRQDGNSAYMLNQVLPLISYISQFFTLEPGDVVMTGTPAGVGPILQGDQLEVELVSIVSARTSVIAA
ncbi:fumarylacetoacetate hydrolase family protein [Neptunomonas antarctica]|uniref:2-keto-4-pentenoate hydratase/2-oxohepta-3-ene-1,7-dioic acid hydratase (Catechol pathway) n=1 Tax=Neptunomonas antarctica TaxID=619304 RepID=A0A1N7J2U6_9GAMM|nr:fumarylacetoacetate hydrolase family protein [Neptunomonas antarctica]SIS43566.1 2-keto-4-pentenoate hydratase/2-oxohepta-3-ene-1,7-dioic acid hydratase (catechol pathway) [Neptunomonas antarctica]